MKNTCTEILHYSSKTQHRKHSHLTRRLRAYIISVVHSCVANIDILLILDDLILYGTLRRVSLTGFAVEISCGSHVFPVVLRSANNLYTITCYHSLSFKLTSSVTTKQQPSPLIRIIPITHHCEPHRRL